MATEAVAPQRTNWAPVMALGLAMLVVTSEMTIAAVTLPGIGADLAVSPSATAWVLLAYALPMAAVAIPAGRWADRADVRAAFALAMIGIGVASVVVALAPAFWVVVAGRLLQGAAGALVVAVYMPIITTSVRREQRGRAIGFVITIMTVGAMAAVPLAGLVAGGFGWRAVFLVKLPLVAAVLWVGLRTVARLADRGLPVPEAPLVRETLLLGGAVAALLLTFEEVDARPVVAVGLGAGAVALAFWWSRLAASRPVLALVRAPAFGVPLLSLLANAFTGGLVGFLLPYYVADVLGGGPDLTGVALLFFVGAMAPLSAVAGALADRLGTRLVAVVGGAVTVVAMLLMLTLDADAGLADLAWRLVVLGIGAALYNPAINAAMLAGAPAGSEGVAGGVGMTVRTIAMTVAPAASALTWTLSGGGVAGFRNGATTITVAVGLGLLVLLVPVRRS
ncbi:MFS transporter [Pseudonocardia kunmingensis]|uniref:Putative MFS family arabinose efflux permease n=1 Tax=Pseudonocardia kunmingensis TaxID=630975 RepID=A0A543E105_9PSEU|nr:MFS transporter [Pseudonocardia kunmingensis]TQM15252.1 putative MFS family arabinose efflux permease [Pseudonocardia kunmingensis]